MRRLKLTTTGPLVFLMAIGFILLPLTGHVAKSANPTTLSMVSFVPLTEKIEYQSCKHFFVDRVNEKANGELKIDVKGGPEIMSPFELGVAVQKGFIDIALLPTAFYESLVPGADSTKLSQYTALEERQNGVYEYLEEMYQKVGLHYLGRSATNEEFFYLFLKKKVENQNDFKGLKLGGTPSFHGFYKKLGASVVTISPAEYHPAMERGVVDGVVTSPYVALQNGLAEVSGYLVTKGFYRASLALIMNLEKWNSLPAHLQKIISESMVEYEKDMAVFEAESRVEAMKKIEDAGVEMINLTPEVNVWFVNAAHEGSWDYAEKKFPGDLIPNLKKKLSK